MKYKTKAGEKISGKEFMSRWKKGMQGVTPLQQTRMTFKSTFIMLFGLLSGTAITLLDFKNLWWLTLILAAGSFNVLIMQLGTWQKLVLLKQYEFGEEIKEDKK